MKRFFGLFCLLALAACTAEQVQSSVSQGLMKSCRNNPAHCTAHDPDASVLEKGAKE